MESCRRVLRVSALLFAATLPLGGAPVEFERISLREGLSQSVIESIVQDRKGFLWFGTEDGLNRFDGYGFTIYRYQPGNPRSLSYNEIKALYEDRSGILWVGTFEGGLNRFDPTTATFTAIGTIRRTRPASRRTRSGAFSRTGPGISGSECRVEGWTASTGHRRFAHHRHDPSNPESLAHDDVRALLEDRSGVLWVGTYGGGSTASTARKEPSPGSAPTRPTRAA